MLEKPAADHPGRSSAGEGRAPGKGWRKKSSRPKSDVTVAGGRDVGI